MKSGGDFLVYQPQIASWDNQKMMVAYSAVSYRAKPSDQPKLGTVKLEANTKVSVTERLVSFQDMKITEVNFQDLDKNLMGEIATGLDAAIGPDERVIALDRVLAALDKSSITPKEVEGVQARFRRRSSSARRRRSWSTSTANRSGVRFATST